MNGNNINAEAMNFIEGHQNSLYLSIISNGVRLQDIREAKYWASFISNYFVISLFLFDGFVATLTNVLVYDGKI